MRRSARAFRAARPLLFDLTAGACAPDLPQFRAALAARRGPLLALDVGARHVGVARSDDGRSVAFPLLGFARAALADDRARVQGLAEGAAGVVVGIPVVIGGARRGSPLEAFVEAYARAVLQGSALPVAFVDESFTTGIATGNVYAGRGQRVRRDYRKRKELIDAAAAAEILQCAIDTLAVRSS